ncbi:MAG: DUF615 domain-containing protein [Nitrospirae bacterium]|nr:DUF615 domain-containing protein [Nitrospirota bacterium]
MEKKSKSQKKREALRLQELGEKLVTLSAEELDKIDLPEALREAIDRAKNINSRGGLRRQTQYIGALMRRTDAEPLENAVDAIEKAGRADAALFKELEDMREKLLGGDIELFENVLREHPSAGRKKLESLINRAAREAETKSPPRAYRELFRYLREIRSYNKTPERTG